MKQGFVIAKNKKQDQFFSAKGAYDRPVWTSNLEEAAVYHDHAFGQSAVKKLWMNSSQFTARVVSLQELEIAFVKHGDDSMDAHHDEAPISHDDENVDDQDVSSDDLDHDVPADDSDELTADIDGDMQSDSRMDDDHCECPERDLDKHEEDCEMGSMPVSVQDEEHASVDTSRIVHTGQTVKWNGQDATVIVPNAQGDFVVIRVNGLDKKVPIGELTYESVEAFGLGTGEKALAARQVQRQGAARGDELAWRAGAENPTNLKTYIVVNGKRYGPYDNEGEARKVAIAMGLGMSAQIKQLPESETMPKRPDNQGNAPSDDKNPQIIPDLREPKVNTITFDDPVGTEHKPETDLWYSGALQNGEKVKIPANVLPALRDSINVFKKAADFNNTRDDAQASFCMTVVSAMEELLDLLSVGTADGVKQAQIKITSWMNPITTNIPEVVRDYVLRGGREPTLKDMFDMKREEALLKKVSKGLNQKD